MEFADRFPSRAARQCPACLRDEGQAISVTLEDGLRTVAYLCQACQHRWEETTRAPDALFLDNP